MQTLEEKNVNRLEQLRQVIDDILRKNPDVEEGRAGFVHLYGVSALCTLLALKRGLDPELCSAAGMLHDIWNYKVGDSPEHGQLGAVEARKILEESDNFSPEETVLICTAIAHHSDKQAINRVMDELLKDADVFQHYLYNPSKYAHALAGQVSPLTRDKSMREQRLERVLAELGI
jgi:uncharacterized protein